MKIESLKVDDFRVLRKLEVNFTRSHPTDAPDPQNNYRLDFLVGVNGTGKSTLLRVIGMLFYRLMMSDEAVSLPYRVELSYSRLIGIREGNEEEEPRTITLSNRPEEGYDSESIRHKEGIDGAWKTTKVLDELLPDYVVVYTTGNEESWRQDLTLQQPENNASATLPENEQEAYIKEMPGRLPDRQEDTEWFFPERRFLFITAEHLPLVALGGLLASQWKNQLSPEKQPLWPVLQEIRVEKLAGFSLRIRLDTVEARPKQADILNRLISASSRVVQQGADRLLVFDMNEQAERMNADKKSIFTIYDSALELFQHLFALYDHAPHDPPPLRDVYLFLQPLSSNPTEARNAGQGEQAQERQEELDAPEEQTIQAEKGAPIEAEGPNDQEGQEGQEEQIGVEEPDGHEEQNNTRTMLHRFDWLSDGEQSFLARMALFALFRQDNLLILLDEPEVHFNDVWKREIVYALDKILAGKRSHALITTHSSITLTDVRNDRIMVLHRSTDDGYTGGDNGAKPPSVSTLGADPSDILVHVFNTSSASGSFAERYISEQIGSRALSHKDLEDLETVIAPGYWRYRIQLERARLPKHA